MSQCGFPVVSGATWYDAKRQGGRYLTLSLRGILQLKCRKRGNTMRQPNDAPPVELLQAINEFNGGAWFECHETLEELWVGAKGELRDFYQGMLQLAVAQHHWRNGNFKGALTLVRGGADLLSRVAPVCQGVDVAGLAAGAGRLHAELSRLGEGRMQELAGDYILEVLLVSPEGP